MASFVVESTRQPEQCMCYNDIEVCLNKTLNISLSPNVDIIGTAYVIDQR